MTQKIKNIETKCPECFLVHVDSGEWYDRPHKTHLCLQCGATWRPSEEYTRGVPIKGGYSSYGGCSWCGINEVCTCLPSE